MSSKTEESKTWAGIIKFTQICIPIIMVTMLPWCVWVTSTLFQREVRISKLETLTSFGPLYTEKDAEALRLRIITDIDQKTSVGTQRIMERFDQLQAGLAELKLEVTRHTSSTTTYVQGPQGPQGIQGQTGPAANKP